MPEDPHLRRARVLLDEATHGLSDAAWSDAREGHWSPAGVVEHLGKAYHGTAAMLEQSVTDGAPKGRAPHWRQRLFTWLIVDVGYFPTGAKAPAVTLPQGLSGAEALVLARSGLEAFDAAAARCLAAFGPDARVATHPILGGFTVGQWRRFHWSHTRHHMRQVARLRAGRAAPHRL
jgi:hypothetical protein